MINHKELYFQCKNFKVLIVEDYLPLQEKMASILEDYFHSIIVASDGNEGLAKYLAYQKEYDSTIDIVFCDINMPNKDGLQLSKDIFAINSNQIIVIISAYQETEHLIEFIEIGISQFLPKPIIPDHILTIMDKFSKKLLNASKPIPLNQNHISLGKGLIWKKQEKNLFLCGNVVNLSKYEYIIVELLIVKIGSVCTNDAITAFFYENEIEIDVANIRNIIGRLRKKLPENMIEGIYGLGYMITAYV